jgi:lipopolysaccharide biosynthesis protein
MPGGNVSMSLNRRLRGLLYGAIRLGFRLTPLPVATRDRLRQAFLARYNNLVPAGPLGLPAQVTTVSAYDHAAHPLLGHTTRRAAALPTPLPATVVAFYLPQFHPIPENDRWWGAGFTEWHNVTRALPQYEGHLQPRLPADLGFYDLRVPEVMFKQMALAKEYGIGAFCTYFYWFAGKTLLEAPLRQWLLDSSLDLPICLCWANENWSRRWDGRAEDVLIRQDHSAADDLAFIAYVSDYLRDPRYLRVEGKPVLLVYRPGLLPDAGATAARWRSWCRENGVGEIHLAYVQSFDNVDPRSMGFDAAVAFPPNNLSLKPITGDKRLINPHFTGQVFDWRHLVKASLAATEPSYRLYPCVNPGWDNEARRAGSGRSFVHVTPRALTAWTREAISIARRRAPEAPLVFVNAWNEWAEGAVLEPDVKYGHAWLEAIRRAMLPAPTPTRRPCAVIHVWYVELLEELLQALRATDIGFRVLLTVPAEREAAVRQELQRLSFDAELFVSPNRGRDILPFLKVAARLRDEGESLVLKLHTKQSSHRENGIGRHMQPPENLASPERAKAMIRAFANRPDLGLVTSDGRLQHPDDPYTTHASHVAYLCSLAGVPPPSDEATRVVAGSMFWCRLDALEPLIDAPLSEVEFAAEAGQVDGTLAHAIERVVSLVASHQGYATTTAAAIAGEPEPTGDYANARRS